MNLPPRERILRGHFIISDTTIRKDHSACDHNTSRGDLLWKFRSGTWRHNNGSGSWNSYIPRSGFMADGRSPANGLVKVLCKAMSILINLRIGEIVWYNYTLHTFRVGKDMGTTSLQENPLQKLTATRKEILY